MWQGFCHRISLREILSVAPASIIKAWETSYISRQDMQFLHALSEKIKHNEERHLEMPLPFRARPQLQNNRQIAMVWLKHLKRKMEKYPKYKEDYLKFMDSIFHDGEAEEANDALGTFLTMECTIAGKLKK